MARIVMTAANLRRARIASVKAWFVPPIILPAVFIAVFAVFLLYRGLT